MIAADAAKIDDVGFGHRAAVSDQGLADLQVLKILLEGMAIVAVDPGTRVVFTGDGHEGVGGALQGGALHVVLDRPGAAQFLAATGAARAAVHQHRQRRAVAGGFARAVAVEDQHASVPARGCQDDAARLVVVVGVHRTGEAALAKRRDGHRLFQIAIGHEGADRAKGLNLVHQALVEGIVAKQQGGRIERATAVITPCEGEVAATTQQHFTLLRQLINPGLDIPGLVPAHQRSHVDACHRGIPHHSASQARLQGRGHSLHLVRRHNDAANRGTFLPRLDGHLPGDFPDKQGELRLIDLHRLTEDGAVKGVGLHREGNRLRHNIRMDFQLAAGAGGAGKRHHVLLPEMVEQVAGTAADQLHGSLRETPAGDDLPHHRRGQVGAGRRRLDDNRHACRQAGSDLFKHAPAGKIVGVDMHRHTGLGAEDMAPQKRSLRGQPLDLALNQDDIVGKLAGHQAGVAEYGADSALDIHPAIGAGGTGASRHCVEIFLLRHQVPGHGFQGRRALVKRHGAQRRTADLVGVAHHRREIDAVAGDLAHGVPRHGIKNGRARPRTFLPLPGSIARQFHHPYSMY